MNIYFHKGVLAATGKLKTCFFVGKYAVLIFLWGVGVGWLRKGGKERWQAYRDSETNKDRD